MQLASIRRPETGITLRSFSQIIHDLLRGKWQLLQRLCWPLPFNPLRAIPAPGRLSLSSFMLCCVRQDMWIYMKLHQSECRDVPVSIFVVMQRILLVIQERLSGAKGKLF